MQNNNHSNRRGAAAAFNIGGSRGGAAPQQATREDVPEMRAVALMSHEPASLQFSSSSSDGPSFGKAPPSFSGISKPTTFSSGGLKRATSAGLAKEWKDVTVKSTWNVCDLEQVPMDFPLERTHREIYGADAKEVASRIQNSLRLLSIQAEYDGAKAKAKCTTCDMVSFRIRLFAGGEGGLPVVVEVQRRNGSLSSFMNSCRAILDGAEGKEICPSTVQKKSTLPPFMKGPIGGMKCLESAYKKADPVADMNGGLNKAADMLKAQEKDTNILGLENLCHMTDALKTRPDVALMAAKRILLAEDCDLREDLAVALQRDVFTPDEEALNSLGDKSRHLALVIFSNSLALASKGGFLEDAVKSQKWFTEFLIPSLLDEVRICETSANNSYEAACGLYSLASCSEAARRVLQEIGAKEDLQAARKFGTENHELLSNETERCLQALGVSSA